VSLQRAYAALGSNLGDRDVHLAFALAALADIDGIESTLCSPVYESDPVGPGPQSRYLNAVLSLETSLSPGALLDAMLSIEDRAGRIRGPASARWGSRTLDLDLLLFADCRIDEPDLRLPHPGLSERAFVLAPLADLAPDLVHPVSGHSIKTLLGRVSCKGIRAWEPCARIATGGRREY